MPKITTSAKGDVSLTSHLSLLTSILGHFRHKPAEIFGQEERFSLKIAFGIQVSLHGRPHGRILLNVGHQRSQHFEITRQVVLLRDIAGAETRHGCLKNRKIVRRITFGITEG